MLLKQSASRNIQRKFTKGLQVKYALQTCAALAIIIWMIYQLKLFIHNKADMVILTNNTNAARHHIASSDVLTDRIQSASGIDIKLLGRKTFFPQEYEEKPARGYSDSDGETGSNESYEMQQLASDDEEQEEEREVDRMEDLIDSNDRDDDDDDDDEGVLDEDEIEHIHDEHIEEAESTKDADSKVVENVNKNEIRTTMLMDT